jgi:glycosyltransferase involved in cell wall biosynthesis
MSAAGVSFVVTVYNKRGYLPGVLAALLAQEGDFERETIVVDDGSTDGSGEWLAQEGPRLPGFRLIAQPNMGPSIATNRGLSEAAMPLVRLVDGDDLIAPGSTRALIEGLERLDAAVMIGAGMAYRPGVAPPWPAPPAAPPRLLPDPLAALIRRMWFTPSSMLIRREALLKSGGCDERVFVQDYSLALRLARDCRFGVTDAVVMAGPEGSGEGRLSANKAQILHDLNLALLLFLDDHPELPARYRRLAWRRAGTRAAKWAWREAGRPLLSSELLWSLRARLPWGGGEPCRRLLAVLRENGSIRLSPNLAS